jgi:hypothetical protein
MLYKGAERAEVKGKIDAPLGHRKKAAIGDIVTAQAAPSALQ